MTAQTLSLELTADEARAVLTALRKTKPEGGRSVADRIKPFVAALPPEPVRCPHTKSVQRCGTFGTEAALTAHLAGVHHYQTNDEAWELGDRAEDTAETNAWDAFHRDDR